MNYKPKLRPLSVMVALSLFASAQHSWAQEDANDAEETSEAETLDTVTVTGSRIKRAGYDTLEPAITVQRDYIDRRGLTNVADALNELPGFGVGVTPEGGQPGFGTGVNFVNRFGLGTNRTLTLVNGRRFVSSNPITIFGPAAPGLQVDLNAIPVQLIERVDNLTVGGAPTYGSDAIAGTVNVILREDYQGTSAGSTVGITEDGENLRYNARVLWGSNFAEDRGNIIVSAAIDRSEGVLQSDVEIFSRNRFFGVNPTQADLALQPGRTPQNDGRLNPNVPFNTGPADGIPNAVYARDRRLNSLTPGGLLFPATGGFTLTGGLPRCFGADSRTCLQFDTQGNLVPFTPGIPFGSLDASGGDGFNLTETGQVTSDLKRANLYSAGHFDFADNVRGYYEFLYFRSEAEEIIDQPIYNATVFGGLSAPLTFSATDPRLTPQARARLGELGITTFRVSRASRDLVENNASGETDIYRTVAGVTWDLSLGERDFTWDTSITYGKNKTDNFATVLNQQNFVNAVNVRLDNGRIVCDPAGRIGVFGGSPIPNGDPNCIPIDLFGEGRTSAEARDYVTGRTRARSDLDQLVFNTNFTGTAFDYWAGSLGFSIGYEHREEEGDFNPDAFQRAGLGRSAVIGPNGGKFDTDEIFGEILAPLVSPEQELFGVHSLDLELKGRRVDNSINGSFDTYTYGFSWSPIPDLRFRGNKTRSLRAPALVELFTPSSSAFFFINDPCDSRFINSPPRPGAASGPGAPRFENCQALFRNLGLVGAGQNLTSFQSTIVSASQQGLTGGDPNLRNEDSKGSTFGFVWEPEFVPGLSLSMDYIEIDIRDAIVQLTGTQIANACYDDPNFNRNDPRNGNEFCRRLNRDAAGQLTTPPVVRTGFANAATQDFRGITGELGYSYEWSNGWTSKFGVTAFNLRENSTELLGTRDFADEEIGNSPMQVQYSGSLIAGPWNFSLQANYQSSAVFDRTFTVETRDILRVDSYLTWDTSIGYRIGDNGQVRLAVTNLFDEEPPFGVIGVGTYDILGRRYALSFDWNF